MTIKINNNILLLDPLPSSSADLTRNACKNSCDILKPDSLCARAHSRFLGRTRFISLCRYFRARDQSPLLVKDARATATIKFKALVTCSSRQLCWENPCPPIATSSGICPRCSGRARLLHSWVVPPVRLPWYEPRMEPSGVFPVKNGSWFRNRKLVKRR